MYLEGRGIEEIAAVTGWNKAVIKVRAFRARAQLRKRYSLLMKESS
jgi:DNA-directed RNA polymerase specialized sigma24 family protein